MSEEKYIYLPFKSINIKSLVNYNSENVIIDTLDLQKIHIPDFWFSYFGNSFKERLEKCNYIITYKGEENYIKAEKKVLALLHAFLLRFFPAGINYYYILSGDDKTTINQSSNCIDMPIPESFLVPYTKWEIDKIEDIDLLYKGICVVYLNSDKYHSLFRSLRLWSKATYEMFPDTRCFFLVAALESIFNLEKNRSKEQFALKANVFIDINYKVLQDIYDLRSKYAHGRDYVQYNKDIRDFEICYNALIIELIYCYIVATILSQTTLLENFETDERASDFWDLNIGNSNKLFTRFNIEEYIKDSYLKMFNYPNSKDKTSKELAQYFFNITKQDN